MRNYAHFEHLISFAVVGVLFSLAYPRRTILVCCIVFGGAALLEFLQTLTPDRHGTRADALEKMAGRRGGHTFSETHAPTGRRILDFVEQAARFSSSQHNH
jgi:VanZ family protein